MNNKEANFELWKKVANNRLRRLEVRGMSLAPCSQKNKVTFRCFILYLSETESYLLNCPSYLFTVTTFQILCLSLLC